MSNETQVHVFEQSSENCTSELLEVLENGKFVLKCADGTVKMEFPEDNCVIEKVEEPQCFFKEDVDLKVGLFEKCQRLKSPKIREFSKFSKTILIDDRKCGITNGTDLNSILCFSTEGNYRTCSKIS